MTPREPGDLARLLLRKAGQDLTALRKFADEPEIADDILGFHAQQAAEKSIKAALTANGAAFGRTHDLDRLVEGLRDTGVEVPDWVDEVLNLDPYATTFRYVEATLDRPFDRAGTVALIEKVQGWAEDQVAET